MSIQCPRCGRPIQLEVSGSIANEAGETPSAPSPSGLTGLDRYLFLAAALLVLLGAYLDDQGTGVGQPIRLLGRSIVIADLGLGLSILGFLVLIWLVVRSSRAHW
ncbi:MAG TPA: hypothetical protein VMH79_04715 [Thermoanaerobaculia bacterium]|nr:hypothetical protein [Thermoanaerobaculia bacterium]